MSPPEVLKALASATEAEVDRPKRRPGELAGAPARRRAGKVVGTVQKGQRGWHRALDGLRQRMESDAARADRLKKKHDGEQTHPGKRCPPDADAAYGCWEYFCDAGQLLLTTTHQKLVARLSLASYKRGLSLLNVICRSAEHGGYVVDMVKAYERLRLSKEGAYVEVRITEKLTRGTRYRVNSWNKSRAPVRTLTPTGKLVLFVEQQGAGHTELADLPDQPLENQFERVFAAIGYRHKVSVQRVAEWAERERQWEESEIARHKEERQRREAQGRAEEESQRRRALISEIEDWRRAELIRAYLCLLDSRLISGGHPAEEYTAWRQWALTVADHLDPTPRRVGLPAPRELE
ncbi:hypothetical protein [Caballeronia sp. GAWG2-1]|uniref:hypothetical protein n=1 Tax=Caballeronia sp. GAWG2-1 TaxID=2921744 RepID=UPI0020290087|nr:hypothetical protein [Caballeronia sp. GAWG2-1]